MSEMTFETALAVVATEARRRIAAYDSLPASVRERLDNAVISPDTAMVLDLYLGAESELGAEQAEDWILRSIDAWVDQQVGYVAPLKKPPRRPLRRRTPDGHKLAPAVPTVVS